MANEVEAAQMTSELIKALGPFAPLIIGLLIIPVSVIAAYVCWRKYIRDDSDAKEIEEIGKRQDIVTDQFKAGADGLKEALDQWKERCRILQEQLNAKEAALDICKDKLNDVDSALKACRVELDAINAEFDAMRAYGSRLRYQVDRLTELVITRINPLDEEARRVVYHVDANAYWLPDEKAIESIT